ncbi:hypothetical protein M5689_019109 [Euphorbia peplus]|nr:hypothetical protein M5689_019109 [Euphorbia peplus]
MTFLMFLVTLTCIVSSSLAISEASVASPKDENLETYIVLLKKPAEGVFEDSDSWFQSFLPATAKFGSEQSRLVVSTFLPTCVDRVCCKTYTK